MASNLVRNGRVVNIHVHVIIVVLLNFSAIICIQSLVRFWATGLSELGKSKYLVHVVNLIAA